MKLSIDKIALIQDAWLATAPPAAVAKELRLSYMTILREYVRLDETNQCQT